MEKTNQIAEIAKLINEAKHLVFFGGAGVSVPSGIPDFRSADGIYSKRYNRKFSAEEMISHSFFFEHPDLFDDFYYKYLVYPNAKPNACHNLLAKLEKRDGNCTVITQNIDGLHQMAGSKNVIELHGSIHRYHCIKCNAFHTLEEAVAEPRGVCKKCGGHLKPDVVLFEEGLDQTDLYRSVLALQAADLLIIGGTSLVVYPAAGLIHYYRGKNIIVVNKVNTEIHLRDKNIIYVTDDIAHWANEVSKALNL